MRVRASVAIGTDRSPATPGRHPESDSSSRLEPAHDLQKNFDVHTTLDDDPAPVVVTNVPSRGVGIGAGTI